MSCKTDVKIPGHGFPHDERSDGFGGPTALRPGTFVSATGHAEITGEVQSMHREQQEFRSSMGILLQKFSGLSHAFRTISPFCVVLCRWEVRGKDSLIID